MRSGRGPAPSPSLPSAVAVRVVGQHLRERGPRRRHIERDQCLPQRPPAPARPRRVVGAAAPLGTPPAPARATGSRRSRGRRPGRRRRSMPKPSRKVRWSWPPGTTGVTGSPAQHGNWAATSLRTRSASTSAAARGEPAADEAHEQPGQADPGDRAAPRCRRLADSPSGSGAGVAFAGVGSGEASGCGSPITSSSNSTGNSTLAGLRWLEIRYSDGYQTPGPGVVAGLAAGARGREHARVEHLELVVGRADGVVAGDVVVGSRRSPRAAASAARSRSRPPCPGRSRRARRRASRASAAAGPARAGCRRTAARRAGSCRGSVPGSSSGASANEPPPTTGLPLRSGAVAARRAPPARAATREQQRAPHAPPPAHRRRTRRRRRSAGPPRRG